MSAANALSSEPTPTPEARSAEPSMEDILASIRRIIADDQSRGLTVGSTRRSAALNVTPPLARTERPAPSLRQDAAGQDPARSEAARVDPVRPEPPRQRAVPVEAPAIDLFREPPIPLPAPEAPRAARPLSPVPAAPVVVAAPVAPEAPPHLNPPAPPAAAIDLEDHLAVISEIAKAGAAAIMSPAARVVAAPLDAATTPKPQPTAVPEAPAAGATVDHVFETVEETQAMEEADMMEEHDVFALAGYEAGAGEGSEGVSILTDPLLSMDVGASVESSFQALANSVFMRNTGAVDGMIREMLRPLLKTWLDDNLPTIVERLVRAEIDRVARGGRA